MLHAERSSILSTYDYVQVEWQQVVHAVQKQASTRDSAVRCYVSDREKHFELISAQSAAQV